MGDVFEETDLKKLADLAYKYCCDWFGPPPDSERPYVIFRGRYSVCAYNFIGREYLIQIADDRKTVEEITATVGHEMYHRVTQRRSGLNKEVWVDEMLAALASQWFLQTQGLDEYGWRISACYWRYDKPVPVQEVRRTVRKKGPFVAWRKTFYPSDFGIDIARLAFALEALVGGKCMTHMVGARSLREWIQSLSPSLQTPVFELLEPSYEGKIAEEREILYKYGLACHWIGDRSRAIEYYHRALIYSPTDNAILSRLNEALEADRAISHAQR